MVEDTKHIQQTKDDGDCGLAVMAMLTHRPVEDFLDYVPKVVYKHGLWVKHVEFALLFVTEHAWAFKHFIPPFYKQLSMYNFPKENCMYGCFRPEANWAFHYFMCDGVYLYDPLLPDRIPLEKAKLGYWSGWSLYVEIKQ